MDVLVIAENAKKTTHLHSAHTQINIILSSKKDMSTGAHTNTRTKHFQTDFVC